MLSPYEHFFDKLREAFVLFDQDRFIKHANPEAATLMGYDPRELNNHHLAPFYKDKQDSTKAEYELKQALRTGKCVVEGWKTSKDNSTLWAEMSLSTLGAPGVPQPTGIDGRSLLPIIQGKASYPTVDYTLLFDLQNDPYELANRADKPEQAQRVQTMLAQLAVEQKRYGDTAPLTSAKIKPLTWDYRTIERKPDQWQPQYLIDRYFKN